MSDPMVIAAAVVIVITALTTATVTVLNAFGRMKVEILSRVSDVNDKADTIVRLTNGSATAATEHRTVLEGIITALHEQLGALQALRVDDAQRKNPPRSDPSPERGG